MAGDLRVVVARRPTPRLAPDALPVPVRVHQLAGLDGAVDQPLEQAEVGHHAGGARQQVDADAERPDLARRLEHPARHTAAVERQRGRQPADAAAGDQDRVVRRCRAQGWLRRWPRIAASVAAGASRCGQWPIPGSSIVVSRRGELRLEPIEQRRPDAAVVGAVDDQRRHLHDPAAAVGAVDVGAVVRAHGLRHRGPRQEREHLRPVGRCRPGDQSLAAAVRKAGSAAIACALPGVGEDPRVRAGLLLAVHAGAAPRSPRRAARRARSATRPGGVLGAEPVTDDAAPVVADHVRAVRAEVVEQATRSPAIARIA